MEQESRCLNCGFQGYTECFQSFDLSSVDGKLKLTHNDKIECPGCGADKSQIKVLKKLTPRKKEKLIELAESNFDYYNQNQLIEDLTKDYKLSFEETIYFTDCILEIIRQEAVKEFKRKQVVLKSIKKLYKE